MGLGLVEQLLVESLFRDGFRLRCSGGAFPEGCNCPAELYLHGSWGLRTCEVWLMRADFLTLRVLTLSS